MWKKYFKVIKIVPGPVIIPGRGKIDFASDALSVDLVKSLFENDCPYLEITPHGLKELYKVEPAPEPEITLEADITTEAEQPESAAASTQTITQPAKTGKKIRKRKK
ncbi:MAG: hypothetical protein AB7C90_02480 [Bacteroidales bacterium]